MAFIGRVKELAELELLAKKQTASLVVVSGRRRIGKSSLIQEFAKGFSKFFDFAGLPPTAETTLQQELNHFGWQLGQAVNQPAFQDRDWSDLFARLWQYSSKGRVLILLDEISWMGSKDPNFLGKLKYAWDNYFSKNPKLIMVLCGSVSSWIEQNIISSTGFLGRISLNMRIREMSLPECNQFWDGYDNAAAYEKFKLLSVTGGVPKYLEEIKFSLSAEDNIKQLCFTPSGLLFNEFEHIFTDIFNSRSGLYQNLVQQIAMGSYSYEDLYKKLNTEKNGVINSYLDDLVQAGFVRRDFTWSTATGKVSKLSRFRVSDNYLRFYLKYIQPNKERITRGAYDDVTLHLMPGWQSVMGLQFENLVLNSRQRLLQVLGIAAADVVYDNPFFQKKTQRQAGCQIDYMVQTRHDVVYVCEIKFQRQPLGVDVVQEVQQKLQRLKLPRHVSRRAVLIHVNGVRDSVLEQQFFSSVIDFSELLNS